MSTTTTASPENRAPSRTAFDVQEPAGLGPRPPAALAVSVAEASRLVGIGRTTLYNALSDGELPSAKIGGRRLVLVAHLEAWLHAKIAR